MEELYIVREGDTLSKIARDKLGDMNLWVDLAQWNNIADPNQIKVGQMLRLVPPDQERIYTTMPVPGAQPVRHIEPGLTITAKPPSRFNMGWLAIGVLIVGMAYFLKPQRTRRPSPIKPRRGAKKRDTQRVIIRRGKRRR